MKCMFIAMSAILLVACNSSKNEGILWGEIECYDDFLWVKQTPDTLKQTLCFDFNADAQNYLAKPLKLGIFKKDTAGKFVQLTPKEIEIFADGEEVVGNVISVPAACKELEIGIVFNTKAENKTHYWYIRPIDMAGLERINDKATVDFSSDDAIMEIRLKKAHIMNPLKEGILIFICVVAAAFILWISILKHIFFPKFKVSNLELIGPEPYLDKLKLKRYRKLILTSKNQRQNWVSRMFLGEIKYCINVLWIADVEFEPKDKRSIRIRPDKNVYVADTRILKMNEEYTLENMTTRSKTIMKIS